MDRWPSSEGVGKDNLREDIGEQFRTVQRLQNSSQVDRGWRGRAGKGMQRVARRLGVRLKRVQWPGVGGKGRNAEQREEKKEREMVKEEEEEKEGRRENERHARLPLPKSNDLLLLYELCGEVILLGI
jgi:hypothetical protein